MGCSEIEALAAVAVAENLGLEGLLLRLLAAQVSEAEVIEAAVSLGGGPAGRILRLCLLTGCLIADPDLNAEPRGECATAGPRR